MVNYRRNHVQDGTYFFTVTLKDRRSDLLVREIDALRMAWNEAKKRVAHQIIAAVILPDHLHALIEMQDGSDNYSRLWQDIKKGFTRRINLTGNQPSPWQSRFWEHTIHDGDDLENHFDYIHINPVKHGLVNTTADWPHSTFHRYVKAGMLPLDWAADTSDMDDFGEPRNPR